MSPEQINKRILKLGLKKNTLAASLDIQPGTLSRFLNGHTELGSTKLLKLLDILNKTEALMKRAA